MRVYVFSLAFFSAGIWPMVSILVKKSLLGAAFGIFVTVQNTGNGVSAAVVPGFQPPKCDLTYACCDYVLASMAGLAAVAAAWMGWASYKKEQLERRTGIAFGADTRKTSYVILPDFS